MASPPRPASRRGRTYPSVRRRTRRGGPISTVRRSPRGPLRSRRDRRPPFQLVAGARLARQRNDAVRAQHVDLVARRHVRQSSTRGGSARIDRDFDERVGVGRAVRGVVRPLERAGRDGAGRCRSKTGPRLLDGDETFGGCRHHAEAAAGEQMGAKPRHQAPTDRASAARSAAIGVPWPSTPMMGSFRSMRVDPSAPPYHRRSHPGDGAFRGLPRRAAAVACRREGTAMSPDVNILAALFAGLISFSEPLRAAAGAALSRLSGRHVAGAADRRRSAHRLAGADRGGRGAVRARLLHRVRHARRQRQRVRRAAARPIRTSSRWWPASPSS